MKSYKVIRTEWFDSELDSIVEYIALDSETRAEAFERKLQAKIDSLAYNPFRCRKRKNSDKSVRELIFKGYIIVFRVVENVIENLAENAENMGENEVRILGIFKANTWRGQNSK